MTSATARPAPVTPTPRPPLYTPRFFLLGVSHLLSVMPLMSLTLLALYVESVGGNALDVGLLVSAASLTGIIFRPTIGRIMDHRGRRGVLAAAGLLNVLSLLAYLAVSEVGPLFYALRLVHGVAAGAVFAAYFTAATDVIPRARRAEGIAIFGISGMAAGGLGPIVSEAALGRWGFEGLFLSLAAMAFAGFVSSWLVPVQGRRTMAPAGLRETLGDPGILRLLPVTAAFGMGIGATFTFTAPYAAGHGLGGIGPYFAAYSFSAILLRILFSWVPDRVGPERVVAPALIAGAAGSIVLVVAPSVPGLVLGGAIGGLGHGFAFPVLGALAATRCQSDQRGAVMAGFTAAIDLGVLLCGPILGAIAHLRGYEAAFLGGAAATLAGALYFVISERRGASPAPVRGDVPDASR